MLVMGEQYQADQRLHLTQIKFIWYKKSGGKANINVCLETEESTSDYLFTEDIEKVIQRRQWGQQWAASSVDSWQDVTTWNVGRVSPLYCGYSPYLTSADSNYLVQIKYSSEIWEQQNLGQRSHQLNNEYLAVCLVCGWAVVLRYQITNRRVVRVGLSS